jgi:hypothetical protein
MHHSLTRHFLLLAVLAVTICEQTQANATKIDTSRWRTVTIPECGIRLRLPKRYSEIQGEVKVGDYVGRSFIAGMFTIEIEVRASLQPRLADNKIIRQNDYQDYAESTETIGGRQAIVQSYRGGGVILNGGEQSVSYYAGAIWQLRPGKILSIGGHVDSRESQSEILAVVHSVEFLR